MAFREQVTKILNIISLIFFVIGLVLFESILKPFHRGFFCNDQSIQKPYIEKQTVPTVTLVATSLSLVILTIILCDCYNHFTERRNRCSEDDHKLKYGCVNIPDWIYKLMSHLALCLVGACICLVLTGIGKRMVGRLRPHFIAACKPNYSLINTTRLSCSEKGFITFDVCTQADKKILKEARLSFPSGHASSSAYTAVFIVLYMQYAIRTASFQLSKVFVQFVFICLAVACSLSRISDYFHHWSDVLAGFLIGMFSAIYTIFGLIKLPCEMKRRHGETQIEDRPDKESHYEGAEEIKSA